MDPDAILTRPLTWGEQLSGCALHRLGQSSKFSSLAARRCRLVAGSRLDDSERVASG